MNFTEHAERLTRILNRKEDNYFLGDNSGVEIKSQVVNTQPPHDFIPRFQKVTDNLTYQVVKAQPKGPATCSWVQDGKDTGYFVIKSA